MTVTGSGGITTVGDYSEGIFAHSIGGGGGNGGSSLQVILGQEAPAGGTTANLGVNIGGAGGDSSFGGTVTVDRSGKIETSGINSSGIYAQSVGGGGGVGGRANTLSFLLPGKSCTDETVCNGPEKEGNNINLKVVVGGNGGGSADGGVVNVKNNGTIITHGQQSPGIFAQSVGGGGGAGGNGVLGLGGLIPERVNDGLEIALTLEELRDLHKGGFVGYAKTLDATVGGSGGSSGKGAHVTVMNTGTITTLGDDSAAIFAQSIGGGGGVGGNADAGLLGKISVAGGAGSAGDGGAVAVTHSGDITTDGKRSHGIFAQSVGGGGGVSGDVERFLKSIGLNIGIGVSFGRDGGNSGNGGDVTVNNNGNITTHGEGAVGIFAQSIGGGGGDLGDLCNNCAGNAGDLGNNPLGFAGSGGGAGDGGKVTIESKGNITTSGVEAYGILAQSLGGGGGKAGGFWGSIGGNGAASDVTVTHMGDITTTGDGSHGILAQSGGGGVAQNKAGNVNVTVKGNVTISGANADGIRAQSIGVTPAANGNISVDILSGIVQGGSGTGAGVRFQDGANNTLTNHGTITTAGGLGGSAIIGGTKNETINNFGTVTGNVDLGAGSNAFNNKEDATFNSGATVNLGAGNLLSNAGTLLPGGKGNLYTTTLTGNIAQTSLGAYGVDVDVSSPSAAADRMNTTGTATLAGKTDVNALNTGFALPGARQVTILSAAGGVTNSGLGLSFAPSAVTSYQLLFPNATDVALGYSINFAPAGLNRNQTVIGGYVNNIQLAGGTASFGPIAAKLFSMPDIASLGTAYNQLSPEPLLLLSTTTMYSDLRFSDALHSCRKRDGEFRFVSEGECSWIRVEGSNLHQQPTDSNIGFKREAYTFATGVQKEVNENWHAGFGISFETSTLHVGSLAESDGTQFEFGVIAKRNEGPTAFSASLSVGHGSYHNNRFVNLLVPGTTAQSDQGVTFAASHVRLSRDFGQDTVWYLRPLIDVGITYVYHSAFNETGAGAANLNVKSGDQTLVSLQPGLEVGREFKTGGGILIRPFGMVGVTQFLSGTTPGITAVLQGAPAGTAPFTVTSEMDKTYANLSVGVDTLSVNGITLRVSYTGQFSTHSEFHSASLKLSIPF
ncbi:MAG TPA: autotransporter domain-containing protein [Burkholderiales bacterium]|nr:autotransporter domain-containing protein [Burkholderiales bacterium]